MRPIELKLAGLQSYRKQQVIDFTALCDTGVFGIFGPTGSGKSSILDAITLALYAKVERATNGTQGIMNQAEDMLSVSFTFALRAAHGMEHYRVERQFKRNNDISISNTISRLIQVHEAGDEVLADKLGEVNTSVQQLLGLSVDDFTRAVVLPQGKFAEFLYLKGAERRQMLQRLFNLERYGNELLRNLAQASKETEVKIKEITAEQQGLGDASEQVLGLAEQVLQEAQAKAAAAKEVLQHKETELKTKQQIWEWQQQKAELEQTLHKLSAEQFEINAMEKQLQEAEQAVIIFPYLQKWVQDKDEHQQCEKRHVQALQLDEVARKQFAAAQQTHEQATHRWQAEGTPLKIKLNEYEKALQMEGELLPLQQTLAAADHDRKTMQEELQRVQERLAHESGELEKTKRVQEEQREALAQAEVPATVSRIIQQAYHDQQMIVAQQQQLEVVTLNVSEAEEQMVHLTAQMDSLQQEQSKVMGRLQEIVQQMVESLRLIHEQQHIIVHMERDLPKLVEAIGQAHEEHQLQQQAVRIAATLHTGKPCPVCGALDHPDPATEAINDVSGQVIHHQLNDWQALAAAVAERKLMIKHVDYTLQAMFKQIANLSADSSLSEGEAEAAAASAVQLAHHTWYEHIVASEMDDWLSMVDHDLEQLDVSMKQVTDASEAMEHELHEQLQKYRELEKQMNDLASEIKIGEATCANLQKNANELSEHIEFGKQRWAIDYPELQMARIGEQYEQLVENEHKVDTLKQRFKESEELVAQQQRNIEAMRQQTFELEKDVLHKQMEWERLAQQYQDKSDELHNIVKQETASHLIDVTKAQITRLIDEEEQAKQALELAREEQNAAGKERSAAEQAWLSATQQLARSSQSWQEHLAQSAFTSEDEVKQALITEDVRQQMRTRIVAHREQEHLCQHRLRELDGQLQGRMLTSAEWESIQAELGLARESYEQALLMTAKAERDRDDVKQRHARWLKLEEEGGVAKQRAEQLGLLQQVLRGNAFVDYIAEEQLMQVSRAASERLGTLTRHRYAIEVDSAGGFLIRDNANGGVKRPVSTLSGGEAFLTSLALALALSTQIQLGGQYPLEFFFLDEGFGTLDQDMLENVIRALEQLHSDHLAVGVISHVPELRTRLPRRLIVSPAEPSGRGSEVSLEYM